MTHNANLASQLENKKKRNLIHHINYFVAPNMFYLQNIGIVGPILLYLCKYITTLVGLVLLVIISKIKPLHNYQ